MIDIQTRTALWLARTPLHGVLGTMHRKLARYMDLAENWNNGDEEINGEAWLIRAVAPQVQIVFDVGANVGRWSDLLLAASPRCTVHAFEPSPGTFQHLKSKLPPSPRLQLHPLGLGESESTCRFNDYGENSVLSSFVSRQKSVGLEPVRVIEIPVTTFDRFRALHEIASVDFVKIDTEGFEMAVLRGMSGSLEQRRVGMIQFEYGGTWLDAGETLAEANELLRRHGYGLYRLRQTSLEKVQYSSTRYECFKYANFVAAPSEEFLRKRNIPIWPA